MLVSSVLLASWTCRDQFGFTEELKSSAKHRSRAWYAKVVRPIVHLRLSLEPEDEELGKSHSHVRSLLDPPLDSANAYREAKETWIAKARKPYDEALAACQQLWMGEASPLKLEKIETRLSYQFDQDHP